MTLSRQALDEFRDAWLEAEGDDFASRMARRSLEALAAENEVLRPVLFALMSRSQSELDLHLDGKAIHGHEADASSFAAFVRGIADATQEISKHIMRRQRRAPNLRIVAPTPGSVRVILRAAAPNEAPSRTAQVTRTPSVDSKSLDTVATLLARSQSDAEGASDDVLSALAADLPARAHAGLRRAAKAIDKQAWDVTGELRSERGFQAVVVGPQGAKAILRVLDERSETAETVALVGAIDGQRRSIGALWFAPEGQVPIEAAVPSPDLIERVVQHDAANERVQAVFDVLTIVSGGANARSRRVYTLRSIAPAPEAPRLI